VDAFIVGLLALKWIILGAFIAGWLVTRAVGSERRSAPAAPPQPAPLDPFADHRTGCGCVWHR
jgi:hypothetical protein